MATGAIGLSRIVSGCSGHFPASSLSDETDTTIGMSSLHPVIFPAEKRRSNQDMVGPVTQPATIDHSFNKLFACMSLAYNSSSAQIAAPQFKAYKGLRITVKEKMRLNNIVWREWHMQFVKKGNTKRRKICSFTTQIEDVHTKPTVMVLEGKYWKRTNEVVKNEYMKWRVFYKERMKRWNPEAEDADANRVSVRELLVRVGQEDQKAISSFIQSQNIRVHYSPPSIAEESYKMDMTDELFDTLQSVGFPHPSTRDLVDLESADMMQPPLHALGPDLDFGDLDTAEPLHELLADAMSLHMEHIKYTSGQKRPGYTEMSNYLPESPVQPPPAYPAMKRSRSSTVQAPGNTDFDIPHIPDDLTLNVNDFNGCPLQTTQPMSVYDVLRPSKCAEWVQPAPSHLQQLMTQVQTPQRSIQHQTVHSSSPLQTTQHALVGLATRVPHQHQTAHSSPLQTTQHAQVGLATRVPHQPQPTHNNLPLKGSQGSLLEQALLNPQGSLLGQNSQGRLMGQTFQNSQGNLLEKALRRPQVGRQEQSPQASLLEQTLQAGLYEHVSRSVQLQTPPSSPRQHRLITSQSSTSMQAVHSPTPTNHSPDVVPSQPCSVHPFSTQQQTSMNYYETSQPLLYSSANSSTYISCTQPSQQPSQSASAYQPLDMSSATSNFELCNSINNNITSQRSAPLLPPWNGMGDEQCEFKKPEPKKAKPRVDEKSSFLGRLLTSTVEKVVPPVDALPTTLDPQSIHPVYFPQFTPISYTPQPPSSTNQQPSTSQERVGAESQLDHAGTLSEEERKGLPTAEQKRRLQIKTGFDALAGLVPTIATNTTSKTSKATMLTKTLDYIGKLQEEETEMQKEMDMLTNEIAALDLLILQCHGQLPATGVPMVSQHRDHMQGILQSYIAEQTQKNWKFYVFSKLTVPLFDSFHTMVSTASVDDLYRSSQAWLDQYCSLISLRPALLGSLREICAETSILTDPELFPEQARQAAQTRRQSAAAAAAPTPSYSPAAVSRTHHPSPTNNASPMPDSRSPQGQPTAQLPPSRTDPMAAGRPALPNYYPPVSRRS